MDITKYTNNFTEGTFWNKVSRFAKKASGKVVYTALLLYFAMQRKETPLWAKTVIAGALGYFIAPIDIIPDFIAGVGYTDDFTTLISALAAVSMFIDEPVRLKAKTQMQEWFGQNYEAYIDSLQK